MNFLNRKIGIYLDIFYANINLSLLKRGLFYLELKIYTISFIFNFISGILIRQFDV